MTCRPPIRLGLLFRPPGTGNAISHGQNPFPQYLADGTILIHFACRDQQNRSRGYAIRTSAYDLQRTAERKVTASSLFRSEDLIGPTLDIGRLGAFDDCGAMPSSIVDVGEEQWMYYTGWSQAVTVPFSFHIGLAVSRDGGRSFERSSFAPVLGRNAFDPFVVGAPWVLREAGLFRMWYSSCTGWETDGYGQQPRHYYTIKHAVSADGLKWQTDSRLCLPYREKEYAIGRPVVWRRDGMYEMLYSFRFGDVSYRVGRAISDDGLNWRRSEGDCLLPDSGAESGAGWDDEMTCYACPVAAEEACLLLYNGNNYGRDGFGLALLDAPM